MCIQLVQSCQHSGSGILSNNSVPFGGSVGEQLLLQGDDSGLGDRAKISVDTDLTVDAAHVDDALNGFDLRSGAALRELIETHRHSFLSSFGFLCFRYRGRSGSGGRDIVFIVQRVAVADDGAVAAGVGVFLHLIAAVAFDCHNLAGANLHDDAGVVGSVATTVAEEYLIAHLGVLVTATLLLVVLHAVGAACTVGAGLTLDALAFVLAVCLEKAPVDKDVAPREAIFVAIIIARRRKVASILCPVGGACIGSRIVKVFVAGFFFIPSSSTATFPLFALPPNCDIHASRTRAGSLIVPGCSRTPEGAAPFANNFAPYSSVAIARPIAFFAMAIGEYPTRPSKPRPGIWRTSEGRRTTVLPSIVAASSVDRW